MHIGSMPFAGPLHAMSIEAQAYAGGMQTLAEYAASHNVDHSTAWRRVMRGQVPARRLPDRTLMVIESESEAAAFDAWLRPAEPPIPAELIRQV